MRLEYIKLVGFKSFVDPTKVSFPNNRVAVVGPNGCGKSNIMDAIRWVLGERSAKNLRSEGMTDVIFNGSSNRKPVGQASIELVFDNSDGTIVGEYASYQQISVKRQLTRDGISTYFLNSTKCRRKDVTQLFLGTGLGPRSYSIIEQGMISRVIDAKPEDLRAYLEEAAGISKYKERRRETENRIKHTKENLERLSDLREEITKQLEKLDRQAKAAEKYQVLKQEERTTKSQLIVLRHQSLQNQLGGLEGSLTEKELALDRLNTELQHIDTQIEKQRLAQVEHNDAFNDVQRRYYSVGSDIARYEQSIEHQRERREQLTLDLDQTDHSFQGLQSHLKTDETQTEELTRERETLAPDMDHLTQRADSATNRLRNVEQEMQAWQQNWDGFNTTAAKTQQTAQVEQTRIQQLEARQVHLESRQTQVQKELETLSNDDLDTALSELKTTLETESATRETKSADVDRLQTQLQTQRSTNQRITGELDEQKINLQHLKGRNSSLKALQQAALGKNQNQVQQWLTQHQLAEQPRLAEKLNVDAGWEVALETVLGDYLEAVCADNLQDITDHLSALTQGDLTLVTRLPGRANASPDTLLSKVQVDFDLSPLLADVYIADTLDEALQLRERLGAQASVITRDGVWVGRGWVRVRHSKDERSGVLAREQELKQLDQDIQSTTQTVERLQAELTAGQEKLTELEQARDDAQRAYQQANQQCTDKQAQLRVKQNQRDQIEKRQQAIKQELTQADEDISAIKTEHHTAREQWQIAMEAMSEHKTQRETLESSKATLSAALIEARDTAKTAQDEAHQKRLHWELLHSKLETTAQNRERLTQQINDLSERRGTLQQHLSELETPLSELKTQLEEALNQRLSVEAVLSEARTQLEETVQGLTALEQNRHDTEHSLQTHRDTLEEARLRRQEFTVRQNTLMEQLAETGDVLEAVIASLPEEATESAWAETIDVLEKRISRLGPINLAAIDEYKTQSERKEYLDTQNADLTEALDTLESAISKIDKETRARFKETFDKVNEHFQRLFPQLFGGGRAYLEMTGEDLLDSGVGIMAQPPGKRNSTIHLLSGGEKALTAVSLVFSIFHLNPAPFCLLDEVDAPLDDANVSRFCALLKEMSEKVQFVFITHNKVTMEMADYLMGVTMKEPGVSRLVSVDIAEAMEMAEA